MGSIPGHVHFLFTIFVLTLMSHAPSSRARSAMFVMEEEYRMQKAQLCMKASMNGKGSSSSPTIHEDGTVTGGNGDSMLSGATIKVDETEVLMTTHRQKESFGLQIRHRQT